ncbi:MAG: dUTP diphosphatase [Oscillospiraceae bacterium]|nr:dUTP diphosphatase [Oscillospiraceae bacterium]
MIINGGEVWMCDPQKNTQCKKTACYLYGGPCRMTINAEYMLKTKIVLDEGAYMPERAHPTDAGLDIRSRDEDFWLWPGHSHVFDTGVHIQLLPGTWAKVESKSGLNVNASIVSCGGTIDEPYRGSIAVKLYNFGKEGYHFQKGDKIAQLVILPYFAPELELVDQLDPSDRGDAGFGSTGR